MNTVFKVFLSMSFSGGLLILVLLLGKRVWAGKLSRQWQYYIWLAVILRLLLPFGPETSLLGRTYQMAGQAAVQATPPPQLSPVIPEAGPVPAAGLEQVQGNAGRPADDLTEARPLPGIIAPLIEHIWLLWLAVALGLLIRKVSIYQGFMRYLRASAVPVSDTGLLDQLSRLAAQAGVKEPVELWVDSLVSSPLLTGFFRPCIVLPRVDIPDKELRFILLHELTHYKRRDMFYKWLVQITVCLHWFDPLVYRMAREIDKACEFSCDEAVLAKIGSSSAQDYGQTLLNAMAAVGRYKGELGAVPLSENKQLLKERLGAIMDFQKKPGTTRLLTGALTLCVVLGAVFVGIYPTAAALDRLIDRPPAVGCKEPVPVKADAWGRDALSQAERDKGFDELEEQQEKEWAEAQAAQYRAAGIVMDSKRYFYQGQRVGIFLDIRANGSFYTLDIDPEGTVDIRVLRDADNKITGVTYLTETEAAALLEDLRGDTDEEDWEADGSISIPIDLKRIPAGELVPLGEHTLSDGDQIWYDLTAETGEGMKVFFAKDGQKDPVYWSVHNSRQQGEPLRCAAEFTVGPPAGPGTYELFLQAPEGALGNVRGSISIVPAAKAP